MIRATAPGKLVLMGEYAVLDGAPSIVAAVDRGVVCEARVSDRLTIETPSNDDRFVRAAIETCYQGVDGAYRFYDQNPSTSPDKAGFGRSAAATVAAILAATRLHGLTLDAKQTRERAHRVHHGVQGNGSGIDIVASVYGGLLRVEGDHVCPLPSRRLVVIFSGQSAKTGPRVEAYLSHTHRDEFLRASAALVDAFEDDPVRTLTEGGQLIGSMSTKAGIDYWTPELSAIVELARAHHGGGKPSGAGGGDSVVAMFEHRDNEQDFVTACHKRGFTVIPAVIAPGAHFTEPDHV